MCVHIEPKLKRCPFCGGTDVHIDEVTSIGSYILCHECLGAFFQLEAVCAEDNAEAWNKRTYNDLLKDAVRAHCSYFGCQALSVEEICGIIDDFAEGTAENDKRGNGSGFEEGRLSGRGS